MVEDLAVEASKSGQHQGRFVGGSSKQIEEGTRQIWQQQWQQIRPISVGFFIWIFCWIFHIGSVRFGFYWFWFGFGMSFSKGLGWLWVRFSGGFSLILSWIFCWFWVNFCGGLSTIEIGCSGGWVVLGWKLSVSPPLLLFFCWIVVSVENKREYE